MVKKLSPTLIEILVCPIDNGDLLYLDEKELLYNPRLRKAYEIKNAIPIMLIEKAIDIDDDTHEEFMVSNFETTGKIKE